MDDDHVPEDDEDPALEGSAEGQVPEDRNDPTDPPPGFKAIACPDCSANSLKPSQANVMALGRQTGLSFCTACRNRGWVWHRLSPVPVPDEGE